MKRIGEIDSWLQLDANIRMNAVGSWSLLLKSGTAQALLIDKGCGIAIYQDGDPNPLLTGPVTSINKYWTVDQHAGPGSVFFSGPCDNTLAYSRLIFPATNQQVSEQWRASGAFSTPRLYRNQGDMAKSEIARSLGPSALSNRRVAGLSTPADPGATVEVPGVWRLLDVRWSNLGEKLESLSDTGWGYRFAYSAQSQKVNLEVRQLRDLSKSVRFAPELGNLKEFNWTLTAPKTTRAIVGCTTDPEGSSPALRYVYQKIDTAAETEWGISVERFVDKSEIGVRLKKNTGGTVSPVASDPEMSGDDLKSALAEVPDAADQALTEDSATGNLQIYPLDTPQCRFGRDYGVGDRVTVAVDGTEYIDYVREVQITVDDGGRTQDLSVKIGGQGADEPLNLFGTVKKMERAIRKIQTTR